MKQPIRHRLGSLVLVAFIAAACGTATDSRQEVFDFAEIAEAGPVIESDPSGTLATLEVSTSIDAVCAVAFGETGSLGSLATDQDMNAAGHSDHRVLLGGLTPDTEYFYRLQGVGVDGRLYQSELLTFRTNSAAEALPGRNVAVDGQVVGVSSEFSDDFAATNAIDGNPATEWSSRGDGDEAYLEIDMGRDVQAIAVAFNTRTMSDGTATTESFTITVDGDDTFGPFPTGRTDLEFTGRIVRFDVDRSTGGNTGAVEIGVFEGS